MYTIDATKLILLLSAIAYRREKSYGEEQQQEEATRTQKSLKENWARE